MEMESFSSNEIELNELLCAVGQVLLAETTKFIAFSCFMMGYLPNGTTILPKEPDTIAEFPIIDLHVVSKPGAQNTDGSETEDDDDAGDDQDEEAGDEEDASGDEVEGKGDAEEVPAANGDGASEDEDDDDEEEEENDNDEDDDDDDDGDDGDEETEEEDEEEDEEDTPQPPSKRRK